MLSIIVALAKNNAIGMDNKLLWHIPDDLKRFKKITDGKTIIMGRKTFESLPGVLPNRNHIVLTRDKNFKIDNKNIKVCLDLSAIIKEKSLFQDEEIFVIGGATIYEQALPFCDKLYLTMVEKDFEADTFFPKIDYNEWNIVEKTDLMKDGKSGLDFYYITLNRKNRR